MRQSIHMNTDKAPEVKIVFHAPSKNIPMPYWTIEIEHGSESIVIYVDHAPTIE